MPSPSCINQNSQTGEVGCRAGGGSARYAAALARTACGLCASLRLLVLLLCVAVASTEDHLQVLNPPVHQGRAVDVRSDRMAVAEDSRVNIYQRTRYGWTLQAQVLPEDGFISAVQICRDILAIACDGKVHIYEQVRPGGLWILRTTLTDPATDPDGNRLWGRSLALDRDILVVGGRCSAIPWSEGFATVFERMAGPGGSMWRLSEHLVDPDPPANHPDNGGYSQFGLVVAVSGQTVAVSGWHKVWIYHQDPGPGRHWRPRGPPIPVQATMLALEGDQLAAGDNFAGAVSLYHRQPTGWVLQGSMTAPECDSGGNRWPWSIALDRDTLAVRGTGIFDFVDGAGDAKVHIYQRRAGTWSLRQMMTVPEGGVEFYDSQLQLLALDNGVLVCGAPNSSSLTGPGTGGAVTFSGTSKGYMLNQVIAPTQRLVVARIGSMPLLSTFTTGVDGDRVQVTAAGAGAGDRADQIGFVPFTLTGDGEIRARVISQSATNRGILNPLAQAGLMLRESLDPGSRQVMLALTPSTGLAFMSRLKTGGGVTSSAAGAGKTPIWLRLVRQGGSISGYHSSDGKRWTLCGRQTLTLTGPVHIGLAVSNTATKAVNVVFDGVQIIPLVLVAPTGSG